MDSIFHEKQEGQLCAQHALNALLQGAYFTAVDLASIAQQLDEEERKQMAEGGENTDEYRKFIAAGSTNMDDSGFFSVQVLSSALKVWNLDLIPFNSQNSITDSARQDPTSQKAYICNFQEHWFAVRKIGRQWFNLNSLLSGPELISDTYLSLFLTQLQQEGYSIFLANGILPECTADQVLATIRVTQTLKPKLLADPKIMKIIAPTGADGFTDEERSQMSNAIKASISSTQADEQKQLEAALALSLGGGGPSGSNFSIEDYMTEEDELDAAIKMSLQG